MIVIPAQLADVLIMEPTVFADDRGFLYESFNAREFERATGVHASFVQDNHAGSQRNVLRGLHYQIQQPQGKLVRVISGEVFDVSVDLRRSSPTFGRWTAVRLSAADRRQLWVPPGFAHGYLVVSDTAECLYKVTDYYAPEHERCIRWDDPDLAIEWPLQGASPRMSLKDRQGRPFRDADLFP